MARKKLLTEGEIRQFMKLAQLRPIGDHRIKRLVEQPEEEEMDLGEPPVGGEEAPPMPGEEMGDEEMDLGDEEMDMDMDEEGDDQMISLDDFMSALEMAVEDVTGEPASVEEVPAEGEEEEEAEEMEMEMEPEGDVGMEMEMEPEGEEGEMPPGMRYERRRRKNNQNAIVNEVAKRVAARLNATNRREKMADQLTERIFKRLTK
jgi:hypothetical protein